LIDKHINKKYIAYINERKYTVEETTDEWFIMRCDDEFICRVVSFEEARRVIYMYWDKTVFPIEYLTEDDFDEV